MKVLVLGGAGAVCQHTTRDLAQTSIFDDIIVADYNLDASQALVTEIGDARLRPVKLDAGDYDELLRACQGADVVVNGLPFKYDLPVTRACVEAGVNGLDVSTEETQWDYDAAARDKDVLFIPGVGATPGITNVMARRAADQLDQVREIQINFAAFRCPAPAPGLLRTFIWEFHPEIDSRIYYRDGEFHQVGPFEGLKMVDFPGPIGVQEVCYIPHPETRTMPESLGAEAVSVHGCFPPHAMRLAKTMLEAGLYSEQTMQIKGIEATPVDMMYEILLRLPETKETPLWAYGLVVEVFGQREGRDVKIKLWNRHPGMEEWGGKAAYYRNIAIPLSIGAQMIARGDVTTRGVVPPETALDPGVFFSELARRDIEIHEEIETYQVLH
ncbi:MAG: saccharopine dehydrogenase NADP-binding domain-containing protein [Chloroflexota bacterium]